MNRKNINWQRAIYLISKQAFIDDITDARSLNSLPAAGFKAGNDLEEWLEQNVYKTTKGNALEESIDRSVARIVNNPEYGLSPGWHHSIKRYLYFGKIEQMQLPVGLESRLIEDGLTGRPTMHVVVTEDTSKEEYTEHWKRIETWRERNKLGDVTKRRQADGDRLLRAKFAYDLWSQGKSYKEITPVLEAKFPQLLSDGNVLIPDDVKTIIHNFIKQAGI